MKPKNYARIAAATVSIGLAVAGLTGCVGQPSTPQDIAKSFLEAVQAGDATRAIVLVNPGVSKDQRLLLTDAVLKKAGKIENIVVLAPEASGGPVDTTGSSGSTESNHVVVAATYDVDGKTAQAKFIADRTSDGWRVTGGYANLNIPITEATPAFSVNGQTVKQANINGGQVVVFPGTYQVDLADNSLLTMKGLKQSTADRPSNPVFEVAQTVQKNLDSTLQAFLDGCFAATASVRDHACPNWDYEAIDQVTAVTWKLVTAPTYSIAYNGSDGSFAVLLLTGIQQHLSFSYVSTGFFDAGLHTQTSDNAGADVNFAVKFEGGRLAFTPSSNARQNRTYGQTVDSNFL